jgi:hypothetical protein
MCCTKQSSVVNLDLFWEQVFSYISLPKHFSVPLTLTLIFVLPLGYHHLLGDFTLNFDLDDS